MANRYRYNELHDELGLGWYDYGFRWYDPAVARFVSVDPLAEDFAQLSTFQYASNSPIQNIDLDGLEGASVVNGTVSRTPTRRKPVSEAKFAISRPIVASKVGQVVPYSLNISSVSGRFARHAATNNLSKEEGSQRNALRHVIWQGIITQKFGSEIATEVGDAHEGDRTIYDFPLAQLKGIESLEDADSYVDIQNNVIGREIGQNNPDASKKGIAILALDYFKENGLWTVSETDDGSFKVNRTRITDEQYNKARENLSGVSNLAFTKEEFQQWLQLLQSSGD